MELRAAVLPARLAGEWTGEGDQRCVCKDTLVASRPHCKPQTFEQRFDVKILRQREGLIGLVLSESLEQFCSVKSVIPVIICKLGKKRCHVRVIKQMDSIFLQMGTVLLAG